MYARSFFAHTTRCLHRAKGLTELNSMLSYCKIGRIGTHIKYACYELGTCFDCSNHIAVISIHTKMDILQKSTVTLYCRVQTIFCAC